MWDGFNKRKFPRLALNCEITIQSEDSSKALLATTENLGVGGVCVILNKAFERFTKCNLRLELGGKQLDCAGRVVWAVPTRELGKRTHFDTGIEFLGLEAEAMQNIREFIEDEIKKNPAKAIPV